jgi:exodeoxyribonuclease VII large subunit
MLAVFFVDFSYFFDKYWVMSTKNHIKTDLELFVDQKSNIFEEFSVAQINQALGRAITQKEAKGLERFEPLRNHKSVSVRRKYASLLAQLGDISQTTWLKEWQDSESDRETYLQIESAIDKIERRSKGENLEQNAHVYTVDEAIGQIKSVVSEKIFVIEGEVVSINPYPTMYYFDIKGPKETVMSCGAFAGIVERAGFGLNEGLNVRVTGKFAINKSSRLAFSVQKIELTGEGELLRNLKMLEQKLKLEGLFDPLRKRKIPRIPKRVLLIASSNSAALTDFTKTINERRKGMEIYQLSIKTQGVGAEAEILSKLASVNQICDKYQIETIIITRGGGGKEDLIVFNSEKVVRSIHSLSRPTIVAIGHERDTTLAELVGDLRASTPTQAAVHCSLSSGEVSDQLDFILGQLNSYFAERKAKYMQFTSYTAQRISQQIEREIKTNLLLCKEITRSFSQLIFNVRDQNNRAIEIIRSQIIFQIQQTITKNYQFFIQFLHQSEQTLNQIKSKLELSSTKIQLQSPQFILEKGYAIISVEKMVINSVNEIKKNKNIEIQMRDGVFEVSKMLDNNRK